MPWRLLAWPISLSVSQPLAALLTLWRSCGRSPSTVITTSRRPSPSKSPTPMPRCARATAKSGPARDETFSNRPFALWKTAFG